MNSVSSFESRRISNHCSNIAGCILDASEQNLNVHESLREIRYGNPQFNELFRTYSEKYSVTG